MGEERSRRDDEGGWGKLMKEGRMIEEATGKTDEAEDGVEGHNKSNKM